jgi:hypothetical protein
MYMRGFARAGNRIWERGGAIVVGGDEWVGWRA